MPPVSLGDTTVLRIGHSILSISGLSNAVFVGFGPSLPSLLGPTSSASAQFWRWRSIRKSTNKSLAISTRMRRRSSAPRLHISSGIVSCVLLATCASEGRTLQRISLCRGLPASHLQTTYSKNGARKTWAKDMVCAAVSHRGGCASHAGGLMLFSRTWRDALSMWMNPKCSKTSMI